MDPQTMTDWRPRLNVGSTHFVEKASWGPRQIDMRPVVPFSSTLASSEKPRFSTAQQKDHSTSSRKLGGHVGASSTGTVSSKRNAR
ncbi:unnamed protein product [Phytophthora fragariaefolia]|uniref:Unnamed protein product n=1 Tax=Phytophthora fragariaefolia TaxID=1490495 RepID=A0A9W6XGB0_9STRA|nr:unnamed protein product [Phytophthora fragariaefolia]